VVLPVREFPRFEGTKKDDVVTFIWQADEIATSARWSDREWVLNMADLVGGRVAPLHWEGGFGWDCLWDNQSPLSK